MPTIPYDIPDSCYSDSEDIFVGTNPWHKVGLPLIFIGAITWFVSLFLALASLCPGDGSGGGKLTYISSLSLRMFAQVS